MFSRNRQCLVDRDKQHVFTFVVCLCWIGADNFYDAVEDMIGYRPNPWMKWSWTIITPVLCMVRASVSLLGWLGVCKGVVVIEDMWQMAIVESSRSLGLKRLYWLWCVCFTGLLHLLPGEVQTLDLQQGLWVSWMGNWCGLVSCSSLHDLHPHGDGHQDPAVWGTPDWGELTDFHLSVLKTTKWYLSQGSDRSQ